METKFKVGDKVKFVNPPLKWISQKFLGQIVEITRVRMDGEFDIKVLYKDKFIIQLVHISNLELVKLLQFKYVI